MMSMREERETWQWCERGERNMMTMSIWEERERQQWVQERRQKDDDNTREERETWWQHERGERNTTTMRERREECSNKERGESEEIMEDETWRPACGCDGEKQRWRAGTEMKGKEEQNGTGGSLTDWRMLAVASLVWCMTKPSQDVCLLSGTVWSWMGWCSICHGTGTATNHGTATTTTTIVNNHNNLHLSSSSWMSSVILVAAAATTAPSSSSSILSLVLEQHYDTTTSNSTTTICDPFCCDNANVVVRSWGNHQPYLPGK